MTDAEFSNLALQLITDGYAHIAAKFITGLESHDASFHHLLNGIGQYYHDVKHQEDIAYHLFEAARLLNEI